MFTLCTQARVPGYWHKIVSLHWLRQHSQLHIGYPSGRLGPSYVPYFKCIFYGQDTQEISRQSFFLVIYIVFFQISVMDDPEYLSLYKGVFHIILKSLSVE